MSSGSRHASGELVRAYGDAHEEAEREFVAPGFGSHALLQQVAQLAVSDRSVLICGETGTGKTVIAGALHRQSRVAASRLRVINCAALSETLLVDVMSELEERSARTEHALEGGAVAAAEPRPSVLLDEIGELSPWGQAVLLHKLQHGVRGVRFFAATHRSLDAMIADGSFSRELLWRLNLARLTIAPLRERRDEIVPLALHFLRLGLHAASSPFVSVEPELFERLERYDWPGNVRELKNAMLRALAANEGGALGVDDLPDAVRSGQRISVTPDLGTR